MMETFHAQQWAKPGEQQSALKKLEYARKVFLWRDGRFKEVWSEALAQYGSAEKVIEAVGEIVRQSGYDEFAAYQAMGLVTIEARRAGMMP